MPRRYITLLAPVVICVDIAHREIFLLLQRMTDSMSCSCVPRLAKFHDHSWCGSLFIILLAPSTAVLGVYTAVHRPCRLLFALLKQVYRRSAGGLVIRGDRTPFPERPPQPNRILMHMISLHLQESLQLYSLWMLGLNFETPGRVSRVVLAASQVSTGKQMLPTAVLMIQLLLR